VARRHLAYQSSPPHTFSQQFTLTAVPAEAHMSKLGAVSIIIIFANFEIPFDQQQQHIR
jgi:hypothetical protein